MLKDIKFLCQGDSDFVSENIFFNLSCFLGVKLTGTISQRRGLALSLKT